MHFAHSSQFSEQRSNRKVLHKGYVLSSTLDSRPPFLLRNRLCFYRLMHMHSTISSTEIKTHFLEIKCKAGWTGNFCHKKCPNKLLPGQYYSGNTGSHSCQVSRCSNAKIGEYYTGSASDGQTSCRTAPCTSSTGCKIGGVYAFSNMSGLRTSHARV